VLQPKYIGILSCSGEEFPGGTVSRIATRQVLAHLRPEDTTTICVPLFLAGNNQEQDFVKYFPCITVDGCEKRCAEKSVEKLGRKPLEAFVVSNFFTPEEHAQIKKGPRHDLQWKDHPYCARLAEAIARKIQQINEKG